MGYVGNQTTNSYTSLDKQTITGNGGTSYTLDHAVANVNEIEVFVNNVRQEPSVAYTVSGTALTMTGNVASSDDFYVVFQGKALQTVVPPSDSVTTAMINDGAVTQAKLASGITFVPSGMIASFGMSTTPTGWLDCDGSAVSRTTYADLYSSIGTTWGSGDGSTTFNVPDLRGAFLRGTGSHGSSTMEDGNAYAGASIGTFENDQLLNHTHTVSNVSRGYQGYAGYGSGGNPSLAPASDRISTNPSVRGGDETKPFNASVGFFIKT